MDYDIVIVGAGVAGLTAAIYAGRSKYSVLVIEEYMIGGQCVAIDSIENFPSYKNISGVELTTKMYEQCVDLGVKFVVNSIESVDVEKHIIKLSNQELSYKKLIIATGLTYNKPNIENIDNYLGRGVSYCTVCDANLYKNKIVAVVSNSMLGVNDAEYLSHYASKVYHINSKNFEKQTSSENIINFWNSEILSVNGTLSVNNIEITNNKDQIETLQINGLFVSMGKTPSNKLIKNITLDKSGYIVTDDNMLTNIDSVYAVGDIRSKTLRQIVTACSDGAIAATHAIIELNKKH